MAAEPRAAIDLDGIARNFGERVALAGVSASLQAGQTLATFGPNGAGKTTLLRLMATLLVPSRGGLRVLGCELPAQAQDLRPRIGLVAHEPLLYRDLSARENLRFYARLYGVEPPAERIEELLTGVDMTRMADEPVRTLSRGMVQRVAVCRALLHNPELLLLDEPWAHLDPQAVELVEPLIGRRAGLTRVLVTHDLRQGLAEADLVLGLRAGHQSLCAPADGIGVNELRSLYGERRE